VVQSLNFFYFICVTKNLLILWHVTCFVSKNTVKFALPHPVYVAVFFTFVVVYIVVRHLLVLYFVVHHGMSARLFLYVTLLS
jgi:hypothetical protein